MYRSRDACKRVHNFRYDGKYCDVRVRVQNRVFHCHRLVLASVSEYFCTAFDNVCVTEIILPDDVEVSIFEIILHCLYNGSPPTVVDPKHVHGLLLASHRLRLDFLIERCEEFIRMSTSSMDVVQLLNLARAINHGSLTAFLTEYILTHFVKISRKCTFLKMSFDDLNYLLKRYKALPNGLADENFLLYAIGRWIAYDSAERNPYLPQLVQTLEPDGLENRYYRQLLMGDEREDADVRAPEDVQPSSLRCHIGAKTSTLHMLLRFPSNDYDSPRPQTEEYFVASLNEYYTLKPEWYLSSSFWRNTALQKTVVSVFASRELNRIYSLESRAGRKSRFRAYPSVNLNVGAKQLSVSYPINRFRTPQLCGIDRHLYVYDTDLFHPCVVPVKEEVLSEPRHEYLTRGIFCYDCDRDRWRAVPKMRPKLAHCGVVADDTNKLLYLIGGTDSEGRVWSEYVQTLDHRMQGWSRQSMTHHLYPYEPAGCAINGKIYVCDGKNMEVFDPVAARWTPILFPLVDGKQDPRFQQVWMVPDGHLVWLFHKLSSNFIVYDTTRGEWSEPYSFKGEVGLQEFSDYRDYGLQTVFDFHSVDV